MTTAAAEQPGGATAAHGLRFSARHGLADWQRRPANALEGIAPVRDRILGTDFTQLAAERPRRSEIVLPAEGGGPACRWLRLIRLMFVFAPFVTAAGVYIVSAAISGDWRPVVGGGLALFLSGVPAAGLVVKHR
jgi:hypothetical protein